jgi:asparagine synthase (glutamine-hydrolysing)
MSAAQFRDALPLMAYHLDEPMGDPTCIPLYYISKMARENVTVVLSGEGADETLGGYSLYQRILLFDKLRTRLRPVARLAAAGATFPWTERINGYIARIANPLEEHYRGVVKGIGALTRAELTGERRYVQAEERLREIFAPHFGRVEKATVLNRMLYADLKVWLPENLLLKADKMTMATAVELRVPFLDHKLVEFTATLRDSLKIREGKGKWILRRVMGNEIPPSILQRPKKGFAIPAASWLRFEMRDFIHDTLLARNSACSTYFDRSTLSDVIERNDRGKFSGFQEVWSLIVFEEWHRQFMSASGTNVERQLLANNGSQLAA